MYLQFIQYKKAKLHCEGILDDVESKCSDLIIYLAKYVHELRNAHFDSKITLDMDIVYQR